MRGPADDLDRQVTYLAMVYPKVVNAHLPEGIMAHHRALGTDPAVLVTALVDWCASKCTTAHQYWNRVDIVSDRVRARYRLKEEP